jgi:hypothetical protein
MALAKQCERTFLPKAEDGTYILAPVDLQREEISAKKVTVTL